MGNSASNSKDKKKRRKRDAGKRQQSEEANEEDDWTYEYEYVEVEESPQLPQPASRTLPKQQMKSGLGNSAWSKPPSFDQVRKPLRNAALFVRNYATTLHKCYVARV